MFYSFLKSLCLISLYDFKIKCLIKKCCKPIEVKLICTSFKIRDVFSTKDKLVMLNKSSVVYKFTCVCKATYIGETSRCLNTRIEEHFEKDKNSHVFKHLKSSDNRPFYR